MVAPYTPPELPADHKPITRLPEYFPVSHKSCAQQTEAFFTCFDEKAVMTTPTDGTTAKHALSQCQRELLGYQRCIESHLASSAKGASGKPWWKVW